MDARDRAPVNLPLHAMTKYIHTILVVLFISIPAFAETHWEEYLSHPTPDNAAKVVKIEYSPDAIPKNKGYWAPDLDILRNQVMGGDAEALKLTYRLIQKSDGGLSEALTVILSHTIRSRPEFFLKEMERLKPERLILKSIILMPGLEYVDRIDARQYEIEMRKKALSSISSKDTIIFRDTCLKILNGK